MGKRGPKPIDPRIRFWKKVAVAGEDDCWLWQGPLNAGGYARFHFKQVHRFSYEDLVGPVPPGLDLDHLCRVRHCVNPRHLEPVTRAENLRRGIRHGPTDGAGAAAKQRAKTHCPHGHEYTEENTRIYYNPKTNNSRHRACKTCHRQGTRVKRGLPPGD